MSVRSEIPKVDDVIDETVGWRPRFEILSGVNDGYSKPVSVAATSLRIKLFRMTG